MVPTFPGYDSLEPCYDCHVNELSEFQAFGVPLKCWNLRVREFLDKKRRSVFHLVFLSIKLTSF